MNFEEIKREIADTKITTDSVRDLEKNRNNPYTVFDSSLAQFNHDFESTLPKDCKDIKQYLETRYSQKIGRMVGAELGGPGCNLFKDLEPLFQKTVGFTLHADQNLKLGINHEVIEADVFSRRMIDNSNGDINGYQAIEKWIQLNGKVDFLIERMVGGISTMEINHFMLITKRWYKLLSENGTVFLQFPVLSKQIEETIKTLKTIEGAIGKHRDKFDISYKENIFDTEQVYFLLRIQKLPGAPDSLDELLKKNESTQENEILDTKTN